jgi:hypothetical protein
MAAFGLPCNIPTFSTFDVLGLFSSPLRVRPNHPKADGGDFVPICCLEPDSDFSFALNPFRRKRVFDIQEAR